MMFIKWKTAAYPSPKEGHVKRNQYGRRQVLHVKDGFGHRAAKWKGWKLVNNKIAKNMKTL